MVLLPAWVNQIREQGTQNKTFRGWLWDTGVCEREQEPIAEPEKVQHSDGRWGNVMLEKTVGATEMTTFDLNKTQMGQQLAHSSSAPDNGHVEQVFRHQTEEAGMTNLTAKTKATTSGRTEVELQGATKKQNVKDADSWDGDMMPPTKGFLAAQDSSPSSPDRKSKVKKGKFAKKNKK